MPVVAIIGAGPGMGMAIARLFASHGFSVGLVARRQAVLDELVAQLAAEGTTAVGFAADVVDPPSIDAALDGIERELGPIEVLEFSPADPTLPAVPPSQVTVENARAQIEFYVDGAITAVRHVLPGMLERGSGTIIVTNGTSSVRPNVRLGNVGLAAGALYNWLMSLHAEVADRGVQVGHIAINAAAASDPASVVPLYWALHTERDTSEHILAPTKP